MATRQEIIIKCAKINRFVRRLDYWPELNMDMTRAAYDTVLKGIADEYNAALPLAFVAKEATDIIK